jgi:glucose uptake protein GlcU
MACVLLLCPFRAELDNSPGLTASFRFLLGLVMSRRRKRRSKKRSSDSRAVKSLVIGMSLIMLVFTLALVIPVAVHQRISLPMAVGMALLLWGVSVFALWVCLNARRRRYSHSRPRYSTYTDYSDFETEPVHNAPEPAHPGDSKTDS